MPVVTDIQQNVNNLHTAANTYLDSGVDVVDMQHQDQQQHQQQQREHPDDDDMSAGSAYSDDDLEMYSTTSVSDNSDVPDPDPDPALIQMPSLHEAVNQHARVASTTDDDHVDDQEKSDNCDDSDNSDGRHDTSAESQLRKRTITASNEDSDPDDCITNFLDKCNDNAEARLAARRQARAEAREIRMRELERQQREQEENADRVYDMYADPVTRSTAATRLASGTRTTMLSNSSYHSSRRSSEDSLEDGGSLRDMRHELKELEEKFRKAMIANAQLDNDKASFTYQIELLKDRLEDLEQDHSQLQREHRDKCREHEQLKRSATKLKEDLTYVREALEERDMLISEKGLIIVACEENGEDYESGAGGDGNDVSAIKTPKRTLVSTENAELLKSAGEGSLDVRLKKFTEEKKDLEDQLRSLRIELDEERNKTRRRRASSNTSFVGNSISHNGPDTELLDNVDVIDVQREANKQLADYKFKLQKSEQDIASLQGAVARLESQVVRYRAAAEASERAEDELKVEKRKLQREARESQSRVEELETANSHLQKRLDKLKNAKSTLLKEL